MLIINLSGALKEKQALTAENAKQEIDRINREQGFKETKALILHNGLYYYYSNEIFECSLDREHAFHSLMPYGAPPCGLQMHDFRSQVTCAERYKTDQYLYSPNSKYLYFYNRQKNELTEIDSSYKDYDIKWFLPHLRISNTNLPIEQLNSRQLAIITYLTSHSQNNFFQAPQNYMNYVENNFHNQRTDQRISKKSDIIGGIGFVAGLLIGAIVWPFIFPVLPWIAAAIYGACIFGIVACVTFKVVSWAYGKISAWFNGDYKETQLSRNTSSDKNQSKDAKENGTALNNNQPVKNFPPLFSSKTENSASEDLELTNAASPDGP